MIHYSIGIVPGYFMTTCFLLSNTDTSKRIVLYNKELFTQLASQLSALINDKKISKIILYTGPAPLTTKRTIHAWALGWAHAANIPLETFSDTRKAYNHKSFHLFFQAYGGNVLYIKPYESISKKITIAEAEKILKQLPPKTNILCGYKAPLKVPKSLQSATMWASLPNTSE